MEAIASVMSLCVHAQAGDAFSVVFQDKGAFQADFGVMSLLLEVVFYALAGVMDSPMPGGDLYI